MRPFCTKELLSKCKRDKKIAPLWNHLAIKYIISISFYSPTIEQITLWGPKVCEILFTLQPFSMFAKGVQWKVPHPQALVMEIAP